MTVRLSKLSACRQARRPWRSPVNSRRTLMGHTAVTPEEFDQAFRSFKRSAFRLETLPRYRVGGEDESIARFLAGEEPPPNERKGAWTDLIRSNMAAGKRMHRVHLIRGPLTDYLRWEIEWGYPPNVEAGEEIGILHVQDSDLPELGTEDFWLFDDELAVRMDYDSEGHWLGAAPLTDPDFVEDCRRKRELSVSMAVPLH